MIIETGHHVTDLYRYDRDPAGGVRDVSPLRDRASRSAKWQGGHELSGREVTSRYGPPAPGS
jgi:hypothetical protein